MVVYRVYGNKNLPILSRLINKGWVRIAVSVLLTVSIAGGFWLASPSPVEAVTISFPSTPAATQGSSHTFIVRVDIKDATDLLPVQRIDLWIRDPASTNNFTLVGLPLSANTTNFSVSGVGAVSVTANPASTWAYATSGATVHYGYGFGYSSGTWGPQNFGVSGFGYGYAGGIPGDTYIIFTVTWTPPASWPTGTYTTNALVYGNGDTTQALTSPTPGSFTISVAQPPPPSNGGGGGGGGGGGITPTRPYMTGTEFTDDFTATSEDSKVEILIPEGTVAINKFGASVSSISIKEVLQQPLRPKDTSTVGLVYEIGPTWAIFNPPIDLVMEYNESKIPEGVAEKNLVLATFDNDTGQWDYLKSYVDTQKNTVTAKISHFSVFTILALTRPASFAITGLSINPIEVNLGESVSISALVTNTGNLRGSYDVGLMIDGVLERIKEVTLDSGGSEHVSFTITLDTIGEHLINVGDLFGRCEVEKPKALATFSARDLTISPAELLAGGRVTISITLTNTGDLAGTHEVILKIDGFPLERMMITLNAGESQQVVFSTVQDLVGTHYVDIEGLIDKFEVEELASVLADEGKKVMPAPMVTPALEPSLKPEPANMLRTIPWIIAGIILAGLVSYYFIRKRRKTA